jgi:hypothetical protein
VAVKDVPPDCTVVGIPARVVVSRAPSQRVLEAKAKSTKTTKEEECVQGIEVPSVTTTIRGSDRLPHEVLPDPMLEELAALTRRIRHLEELAGVSLGSDT